ncbi:DedA family protein [Leptolyngbya cf. ectocarpi LEGE 11479]|uniref:DedA family protein n=1 Tax=Leptolyngbya cf. ectocarpi LEGE 11479 TaxID=1828722 RepID=A0A928ZSM4_LEPEC|nr:DedA family protein [Leptolyngbya cf. ectocarpi LEGE 11479]
MLERLTDVIAQSGYWGIALLMLLENVIPPIPSEVIMPLAGFSVARGEMSMAGAIAAGTVGTVLGALVWFYIGRLLGPRRIQRLAQRYGKWLGISGKDVMAVQKWFGQRGGYWSIALGRLLPSIRTYISVPAGIAKMSLVPFVFFSTLGSVIWVTLLTSAGYYLGDNYEQIGVILGSASKIISILLVTSLVGWLVYRWYQQRTSATS